MYKIFGFKTSQTMFIIECLLDYPMDSKRLAKKKWKKVIKLSSDGLVAGFFDSSKELWIATCSNGKKTSKLTKLLNNKKLKPTYGKTYPVANVPL